MGNLESIEVLEKASSAETLLGTRLVRPCTTIVKLDSARSKFDFFPARAKFEFDPARPKFRFDPARPTFEFDRASPKFRETQRAIVWATVQPVHAIIEPHEPDPETIQILAEPSKRVFAGAEHFHGGNAHTFRLYGTVVRRPPRIEVTLHLVRWSLWSLRW